MRNSPLYSARQHPFPKSGPGIFQFIQWLTTQGSNGVRLPADTVILSTTADTHLELLNGHRWYPPLSQPPCPPAVKQLEPKLTIRFLRALSHNSVPHMLSCLKDYICFSYPKTLPLQYHKSQAIKIYVLDKIESSV